MAEIDGRRSAADWLGEARNSFVAALARGDPRAATEVYADDARVMLPASAPVDGRAAIEAFWRTGLDAGLTALELVPADLLAEPTFACEVGRYRLMVEPSHEASTVEQGRYLIVVRPAPDGTWRRALEVFEPDGA